MLDYAKFSLKPGNGSTNFNAKFEQKITLGITCFAAKTQKLKEVQVKVLEVYEPSRYAENTQFPVKYISYPPFTGLTVENGKKVEITLYLRYNVSYAVLFYIQDEPEPVLRVPIRYDTLLASLSVII